MPERSEYAHGTPSFVDLMTTDVAAAKEFYAGLFGWTYEDNPTDREGVVYTMASRSGKAAAGLSPQPPEQAEMGIPPMWNSYVTVDDIDATVAKVEAAGGTVMAPAFDVMDAGRMAVIVDPTGAVLSLWQAGENIGSEVVNEHGALTWNELVSPAVETAASFYAELFGWGTETVDLGEMGDYTLFTLDGEQVGGGMAPPMEGMPPHWGVYFSVDDCDGVVAKAREAGATVMMEPTDAPPGRMAAMADPQGATFAVIQLADDS
jgi:predicted enzyme related to lactoylglutathione lyase